MTKSRDDETYERGVHDGQKESVVEQILGQFRIPTFTEQEQREREIYDKGYKYGAEHQPSSSDELSSSSSDGGCFLTTACISAMNLPDDCLELQVLREFRDSFMMNKPSGKDAIQEYYKIAPGIVEAINKQKNSEEIWSEIYNSIRHAVNLVLSGKREEASQFYRDATLSLKEKYL